MTEFGFNIPLESISMSFQVWENLNMEGWLPMKHFNSSFQTVFHQHPTITATSTSWKSLALQVWSSHTHKKRGNAKIELCSP